MSNSKHYRDINQKEKNKVNKERKRKHHLIGTRQKTDKPSKYLGKI